MQYHTSEKPWNTLWNQAVHPCIFRKPQHVTRDIGSYRDIPVYKQNTKLEKYQIIKEIKSKHPRM